MNNIFSLQKIFKTTILDAKLISRQYKLNLMADFMRIKYENPNLKQSEIANQLGYSSTLQRYKNHIKMLSPYRIQSITPINERKRLQILFLSTIYIANLTLKDPKIPQMTLKQFKQRENQIGKTKMF